MTCEVPGASSRNLSVELFGFAFVPALIAPRFSVSSGQHQYRCGCKCEILFAVALPETAFVGVNIAVPRAKANCGTACNSYRALLRRLILVLLCTILYNCSELRRGADGCGSVFSTHPTHQHINTIHTYQEGTSQHEKGLCDDCCFCCFRNHCFRSTIIKSGGAGT